MIGMKVSIIGAGNMGGAIVRGLAGRAAALDISITISNPSEAKLAALQAEYPHVQVTTCNQMAARQAQLIILAVKPWNIPKVIAEIRAVLMSQRSGVISLAAGISLEQLASWLAGGAIGEKQAEAIPPLYRVIPNTAVAVQQSMTFISSAYSTPQQDAQVLELFRLLGQAVLVDEAKLSACTALTSCGIAYAMRYLRAAMSGGVELGLSAAEAREYLLQTMQGAIELLRVSGRHPEVEIDRVTTPGGYTIRGLNAMEAHGFTHSVIEGLKASVS